MSVKSCENLEKSQVKLTIEVGAEEFEKAVNKAYLQMRGKMNVPGFRPGGSVTAGMAIYDTMQYIKCDVSTICIGMAASMGAFLLSSGAKGKRIALPNAEVMIHQPSAGTQGKVTDMEIDVEHFLKIKQRMNKILSENTGKTPEQVKLDSERDNWMTAEEARDYGLVDKVIFKR